MIPTTRQVLNARIRMRRIQETQRETKRTSREALRRTQEKSPSCTPSDGHWRQRRSHPSSLPRRKPARSPSRPFWSTHTRGKRHDFLWRIHKQVPGNEELVIFNRSHYESVLVERVHDCQGCLFCPETHLAVGKMRMLWEGILFKHSQLALNAMRWTNCYAETHILLDGHCRHYS